MKAITKFYNTDIRHRVKEKKEIETEQRENKNYSSLNQEKILPEDNQKKKKPTKFTLSFSYQSNTFLDYVWIGSK